MKIIPSAEISREIAALLRRSRNAKGLTQQQAAERAGIALAHYQQFEGAQRRFLTARFKTVMSLLKTLDLNAEEFVAKYVEGAAR